MTGGEVAVTARCTLHAAVASHLEGDLCHMVALRTLLAAAVAGTVPLVIAMLEAVPAAAAHGAQSSPASRAVVCDPEGQRFAQSKACQAAAALGGTEQFTAWDNLRVANVNGQDRQVIPDGKLCSGGIAAYKGLDLARADWPATRLTTGAAFTFRYAETIPHEGTFKLYVTKDGYDPTRPLRWSDLEATPFLTVTDPPERGGSYVFSGRLPRQKSGRQLIYTIWQNSSTPDTYYSCSDVEFRTAGTAANPSTGSGGSPAGVPAAGNATDLTTAAAGSAANPAEDGSAQSGEGDGDIALYAGSGVVVLVTVAFGGLVLRRRRA